MHPYKKGADGIRLDYRLNRRHCKPAIDEKKLFLLLNVCVFDSAKSKNFD